MWRKQASGDEGSRTRSREIICSQNIESGDHMVTEHRVGRSSRQRTQSREIIWSQNTESGDHLVTEHRVGRASGHITQNWEIIWSQNIEPESIWILVTEQRTATGQLKVKNIDIWNMLTLWWLAAAIKLRMDSVWPNYFQLYA